MDVQHTWIIESLEQLSDNTGTVYAVYYKVVSSFDGIEVVTHATAELDPPDSDGFIEYSDLTSEIVTDWIKSKEEGLVESGNYDRIKRMRQEGKTTTQIAALPWAD